MLSSFVIPSHRRPLPSKKKKTFGRLSFRVPSLSKPRLLPLGFVVVVVVARY